MTHSATLQIVNATNFKLSKTNSSTESQMEDFAFADVNPMDYHPFDVNFYSGHNDQNDAANVFYMTEDDSDSMTEDDSMTEVGSVYPQFVIQFNSHDYESLHYIAVGCLNDASSQSYVVVTNGNSGVINPTNANDLYWYLFQPNPNPDDPANPDPHATSANDPTAYFIGYVNDAVMGLGIVDLNVLFPPQSSTSQDSISQQSTSPTLTANPNVAIYSAAIKNGLSNNQKTALSHALDVLFPASA